MMMMMTMMKLYQVVCVCVCVCTWRRCGKSFSWTISWRWKPCKTDSNWRQYCTLNIQKNGEHTTMYTSQLSQTRSTDQYINRSIHSIDHYRSPARVHGTHGVCSKRSFGSQANTVSVNLLLLCRTISRSNCCAELYEFRVFRPTEHLITLCPAELSRSSYHHYEGRNQGWKVDGGPGFGSQHRGACAQRPAKCRAGCWVREGSTPPAVRVWGYHLRKIFWKLRC